MSWNYRIVKQTLSYPTKKGREKEKTFSIHEVFYTGKGKIQNRTERPVGLVGSTLAELKSAYKMMGQSFDREVLVDEEIVYAPDEPMVKPTLKERVKNITIQISPFDWGKNIFVSKVVSSLDEDYAHLMCSGFKIGQLTITW